MVFALFSFACSEIELKPLPPSGDAANLMIILHGSGDSAADWPDTLKMAIEGLDVNALDWDIWTYDWEEQASSRLSASGSGMALGEKIGLALLEPPYAYSHLHLVGHSVGSFVVYGLARTVAAAEIDTTIHSTFLDPFTGNGLFDWTYGEREFGRYSNFAEAFYNADDSVPSTNGALESAHNFDVTALRSTAYPEDTTHWWPIDYYIQSVSDTSLPGFGHAQRIVDEGVESLRSRYAPGDQTVLEE